MDDICQIVFNLFGPRCIWILIDLWMYNCWDAEYEHKMQLVFFLIFSLIWQSILHVRYFSTSYILTINWFALHVWNLPVFFHNLHFLTRLGTSCVFRLFSSLKIIPKHFYLTCNVPIIWQMGYTHIFSQFTYKMNFVKFWCFYFNISYDFFSRVVKRWSIWAIAHSPTFLGKTMD